jgi:DNA repair exonuclease SbcCD ATPase subunit
LDKGITSDQGEVAKSQDELKRAENVLTEAQTLLTQCNEELGNANDKLAEIQAKLLKNSHFAPIADRLQEILSSLDRRQGLNSELVGLKAALDTVDEVLTKACDTEAASVSAIAGFEAELSGIETSIHQEENILNCSNESALRERTGALLSLQGKISQAIALSALNGRQSFVDTLFIDEGFGALDSDTLDTAVGVLEIIQSFGRKVGVVTHVARIKERLAVQEIVEKTGAGRSRVHFFPPIPIWATPPRSKSRCVDAYQATRRCTPRFTCALGISSKRHAASQAVIPI